MEKISEEGVVDSVVATVLLFSGWVGCGCSSVYLATASLLLDLRHFKHIFL